MTKTMTATDTTAKTITKGYAAPSVKAPLAPFSFERRQPREHDISIDIKFCGICHSDIHQVRDE